jgi:hypothetical protein
MMHRRLKTTTILITLFFALLVSCGDDKDKNSTGPDNSSELAKLVGSWNCTEYTYTNNSNPAQVYNFLAASNAAISITVESNGNFTLRITIEGTTFTQTGNFNESDGEVTVDEDPNISVVINNNTFSVIDTDSAWDFDDDGNEESATEKIVFQKQ